MTTMADAQALSQSDWSETLISSGKSLSRSQETTKKREATPWLMAIIPFIQGGIPWIEEDDMMEGCVRGYIESTLKQHNPDAIAEIGISDKGKSKGKMALRSSNTTKNTWKYMTVICKAIEVGLTYDEVFTSKANDGKTPSKGFIEKLIKEKKTPWEKVEPLAKTLGLVITASKGKTSTEDKVLIQEAISSLLTKAAEL